MRQALGGAAFGGVIAAFASGGSVDAAYLRITVCVVRKRKNSSRGSPPGGSRLLPLGSRPLYLKSRLLHFFRDLAGFLLSI